MFWRGVCRAVWRRMAGGGRRVGSPPLGRTSCADVLLERIPDQSQEWQALVDGIARRNALCERYSGMLCPLLAQESSLSGGRVPGHPSLSHPRRAGNRPRTRPYAGRQEECTTVLGARP